MALSDELAGQLRLPIEVFVQEQNISTILKRSITHIEKMTRPLIRF